MKLAEFLLDFFQTVGPTETAYTSGDYILTPEILKLPNIQKRLLECDEFKNTKKIVVVDYPTVQNADGVAKTAMNYLLFDETEFSEVVYLYTIALSPKVYDVDDFRKPVKDGVVITPTVYDPNDFTPRKSITVFWSPEKQQDFQAAYDKDERDFLQEQIIDKIKKAFDNPQEYEAIGKRRIMLRMMDESVLKREYEPGHKFNPVFVRL